MDLAGRKGKRDDERVTFLIWDSDDDPPTGNWVTILWGGFGKGNYSDVISLPKLVEEQSDTLRMRYLSWIYDIGETCLKGKRLVDHLELRPSFSYWWMTLVAQKFNAFSSPYILEVIKLLAFEDAFLKKKKIDSILLVSNKKKMAQILKDYCTKANIGFTWNQAKKDNNRKSWIKSFYRSLPFFIQASISLIRFAWQRRSNGGRYQVQKLSKSNAEITFADILVHLDEHGLLNDEFVSNYWTSLIDKLNKSNLLSIWLHSYYEHKVVNSIKLAKNIISRFNKRSGNKQCHILIDVNLSLSLVIKALKDYFGLVKSSFRLNKISRYFQIRGSRFDLWPLFKRDWNDSVRGQSAMVNCLRLNLFESILFRLPCQKLGVYIQENQPWEMALIYFWKVAGHGRLIGVPHTTVRYWDLRYFYDPRSYLRTRRNDLPMPDLVAVNGPVARKFYLQGGYPEKKLVKVEALRYLHLLKIFQESIIPNKTGKNNLHLRILVLGDIFPEVNEQLIRWLKIAAKYLPTEIRYTIKPHPVCEIKNIDFKSGQFCITNAPLSESLADCDIVLTSNATSAAVDAYCTGIPVISVLDGNAFNLSPLRGLDGVVFVTNPMEVVEALRDWHNYERVEVAPFFYLNKQLFRWKMLLDIM